MKMYKLVNQDMESHNGFKWEIGKECQIEKPGIKMCSDQVFHCYNHPVLAVLLNPIHANIEDPRLFEIEVDEVVNNDGLKFASKAQKIVREIEVPVLTVEQRVTFAIKVAKLVCKDKKWNEWADKWLSGEDRTSGAAAWAAEAVWDAAAWVAARAAEARGAAWAAEAVWEAAARAAEAAANLEKFNAKLIKIAEAL